MLIAGITIFFSAYLSLTLSTPPVENHLYPTTNPSIIPSSSQKELKTYRNNKDILGYQFEFQYPSYYEIKNGEMFGQKSPDTISIYRCTELYLSWQEKCDDYIAIDIELEIFPDNLSAENKLRELVNREIGFGECIFDDESVSRSENKVNDLSVFTIEYSMLDALERCDKLPKVYDVRTGQYVYKYFVYRNHVYTIHYFLFDPGTNTLSPEILSEFNKIISTIKIVTPNKALLNKRPRPVVDETRPGHIPWSDAVAYVRNCKVSHIAQTHARVVSLSLKNGEEVWSVEPVIDDIRRLADNLFVKLKCGNISYVTE